MDRSADDVLHCTLLSAIVLQIQTNGRQSDLFMNGALPRHTYLSSTALFDVISASRI